MTRSAFLGTATVLMLAASLMASGVAAQGLLDDLGQRLTYTSADGNRWARLSGTAEVAVYDAEEPPPGLLFFDGRSFAAPRLSVTADAGLGSRLLAHARVRADRGFDPGAESDGDLRADEYYLQADVVDRARGRIRIGKFATAFGDWVNRHLAWDNPLISAPMIYDDMVTITDVAAPADTGTFVPRRDQAENKDTWVPVVWGPSYATGASVAFGMGAVDVLVEAKQAAVSADPDSWDEWQRDTDPTFTGHIAWHPRPEWRLGASYSEGPHLRDAAAETLPAGADLDDFEQRTLGVDVTFEHRRLQLWAELVSSRFDVPNVGTADLVGAFVEARWKLATRWWLAGRLNQSWFEDLNAAGQDWDRDLRRTDIGIGFRHSAHVQAKLEYSFAHAEGGNVNGNRVLAAQLVLWF